MNKIAVKIVRYDMDKTKKRNKKNILVSRKSEQAVIDQLEKIHKGEKVVTIHTIEWDEEKTEKIIKKQIHKAGTTYSGEIKFFEESKGFGFITPDEDMDDLFFHESATYNEIFRSGDRIKFEIGKGPKGICAVCIKLIK